jgi:hypothetical protein
LRAADLEWNAVHICKACASLPSEKKSEMMRMNHLNNQQRSVYQAVIFLRGAVCNCHRGLDFGSSLGCFFRLTYVAVIGVDCTKVWNTLPSINSGVLPVSIINEDLYNIFKQFYRSRFSSDVHGIGLGLPLAKAITEAHGETISVISTLHEGIVFALNFFNLTNE